MTRAWLWAGTIVLAVLGAAFEFSEPIGINWGVWTCLAGAGLVLAAARSPTADGRAPRGVAGCVVLAALLSLCVGVTTSYTLIGLAFVGVVLLLAVAARLATDRELADVGAWAIAVAPIVAAWRAVMEAGARIGDLIRAWRGGKAGPVVRGALIAVPIVCVFALLLSGADPVLAAWREAVFRLLRDIHVLPRIIFGVALGVIVLGAYGAALRRVRPVVSAESPVTREGQRLLRLGPVERNVVLWSVVAVFGLYLVLQLSSYFMDAKHLIAAGMSYASYVHRGVSELTLAATGCVVLLVLLERTHGEGESVRGQLEWIGALVLVAEVVCVLASAYHRVNLYEAAYGYTVMRADAEMYLLGVAVLLVLMAWELSSSRTVDGRWCARRAGVIAVAAVVAVSVANEDALVVARNIARFQVTGKLDANYLATMQLDGLPAALKVVPLVSSDCALSIKRRLYNSNFYRFYGVKVRPWYAWNLRAAQGAAAYRAYGLDHMTGITEQTSLWACPSDSTLRALERRTAPK